MLHMLLVTNVHFLQGGGKSKGKGKFITVLN
jgi:hypothetical protein